MKKIILFIAFGILAFAACKDDDSIPEAKFDYAAKINSPNIDAKHVADVIHVEVEFESQTGETIHHVNVRIFNKSDNTEVYNKPGEAHVHATSGKYVWEDDFLLSHDNGVEGHTDWIMEAKVWGEVDGEEEVTEKIEFHVHPQ